MQDSAQETEPIEGEVPSSDEVVEEVELEKEEAESTEETPEAEALKWKEAAIRTAADLDNYRKRMARERSEDLRFARAGLIEELLPVFDNFSMGLQMAFRCAAASNQDGCVHSDCNCMLHVEVD